MLEEGVHMDIKEGMHGHGYLGYNGAGQDCHAHNDSHQVLSYLETCSLGLLLRSNRVQLEWIPSVPVTKTDGYD